MEEPPFDLRAYEPPISMWTLVEQHVPKHEHEEIKNLLGCSLIDQSLELHQEVDTLLEIWQDYRNETSDNTRAKLPEPPGLRDRLIQEIHFFVDIIKERARSSGIDPERAIQLRHNSEIVEYALDSSRPASRCLSRPGTSHSRDGRETPMITSPTSSDRISAASTLSEDLDSMNDKLNFLKFDEVSQHLRSTLEEEIETLMRDIKFLYDCLDDEATYRGEVNGTITSEPTIADLQQERSRMEKDLINQVPKVAPPTKPAFNRNLPAVQIDRKVSPTGSRQAGKMISPGRNSTSPKPTVPKSSPTNSTNMSPKPRPMKASHTIISQKPEPTSGKVSNKLESNNSDVGAEQSVNKHSDRHTSANTEGRVLSSNARIRQRAAMGSGQARLVQVDMQSGQVRDLAMEQNITPSSPEQSSLPPRPSSAQRFRKMILDCRDSS